MKYSKKQFTSGFTRSVSGRDPKGEIMAVRQNAGMLNYLLKEKPYSIIRFAR